MPLHDDAAAVSDQPVEPAEPVGGGIAADTLGSGGGLLTGTGRLLAAQANLEALLEPLDATQLRDLVTKLVARPRRGGRGEPDGSDATTPQLKAGRDRGRDADGHGHADARAAPMTVPRRGRAGRPPNAWRSPGAGTCSEGCRG